MASLYVGNLDPNCTEAVLYHKFSPHGNLLNIRLSRDKKTGRCSGHGFVNYATKSDAEHAMSTLNYTTVNDRTIRLMWVDKNIKQLSPSANIFIKNLHFQMDERSLHDIFANYGNILSLKLAKNENGSSKGFAFIQYEDEKSAEEAIKDIDQKMLLGKVVHVTKFLPKDKRLPPESVKFQNVYIKNFDSEISDKDLIDMCKDFGDISSAKVMLDGEGISKRFGFVCFRNTESARAAVKAINGKMLNGRRLFADRAKKKLERQKEVQENFKRSID